MSSLRRMGPVVIALAVLSTCRGDEPGKGEAWPKLSWKKGSPSPFARVESPTTLVGGKLYLFGGFTDDLGRRPRSMSTTRRPTPGRARRTCRHG